METDQTINTLHQLLNFDACKFTRAEVQLKSNLPDWVQKASSIQLKILIQRYLTYVEQHVRQMESFFEQEKVYTFSLPNRVMMALTQETNETLNRCIQAEVRDVCLLASLQTINHLKISTYGTAAAFADALGMEKFSVIFREAENDEKSIDEQLSLLAGDEINGKAKAPIILKSQGHKLSRPD